MSLVKISIEESALRIAKRLATDILADKRDPLQHVREFERLWIRAGYPKSILSVGTLYDDLYMRNGTEAQNREFVYSRMRQLLGSQK